ncbi:class I poly(R)-hydroxyalkanoic acid synthase [Pseudogemmobacter faecipullorum]|uniref:Class I poly(R)-hydroxyalkanoic acid synthase n=1 Tax=Pseudogemmobacter faecipullorum TaxID=2755041 RepID=A0ABS8CKJ2_9RHOB|nr:class I poly(R)-hydroxyalkanoic acid synthase [Pseudogemmobacter faecipullorum]MCB5409907.1 class I poly(R)-hydroxyalkanoic acid synthase [Pseudogemmobacter faecipullorum]
MTTAGKEEVPENVARAERLNANLSRMEALTRRLTAAMAQRRTHDPALDGPASDIYLKAATAWLAGMMRDPGRMLEQQVAHWGKALRHQIDAGQAMASGEFRAPADPGPSDRRFSNPLWDSHPWFNYLKQQYQLNAGAAELAVDEMEDLTPEDRKRVSYFTRQIIDMMAPTNFLLTNPDALERAIATDGESLVRGLENMVRDMEANNGELMVTLADKEAFAAGVNLATTPGDVVYRNRLFELIQYRPTTAKVHKAPLLIFPPWINKFYILDMKAQNSLIAWMVGQGFSVFVVSWVNPDAAYADVSLDDYIRDGFIRAIAEVRRITGEKQINATGYCIAGTTLGLTLAHLHKAGDKSVKSATFFTTLTDFSDPGEVGVFLDNDFVDGIERQSAQDGILSSLFMQRTFSFLRSNDLIYAPAIRSYMLGEAPPAFDLLYWNGDATNLPAKMAIRYLRGLCQQNGFAEGSFEVLGEKVSLKDITLPLFAVACETDHIAHWKGSFNGIKQMGAKDKTFILSESGHIAGIINPPSKGKYGHWSSTAALGGEPAVWIAGAEKTKGSWWPRWSDWLQSRSGGEVPAPEAPGGPENPVLAAAPGTYVLNQRG